MGSRARRFVQCAVAGVVVVVIVGLVIRRWVPADVPVDYLAVWIPLLVAVTVACFGMSLRGATTALGLRIRLLDLLWGAAVGLLARSADVGINLLVTGSDGLQALPVLGATSILAMVVAPVLIGPLIEEVFFRGVLQRGLTARVARRMPPVPAAVIGVGVTSIVFALLHSLAAPSGTAALVVTVSTLVFAIGAGALAASTGRIGGAIVAHVVFNGAAVLFTWPF